MQPLWLLLFLLLYWINKMGILNRKLVVKVIFPVLFFSVSISYSQQVKSISGIQNESNDYNPVYVGNNTLLFTRTNHIQNLGGKTDPGDIWMIKKDQNGNWMEAKHRPDLSSKGYDLPLGMEDILTLLVLRSENDLITVHQYSKFGQDWNYLRKVNFPALKDFKGKVTGSASQEGKLIFLSGKKDGGFGNEDIYLSQKTGILDWSDLVNLGPAVNGSSDEGGPFFDPTAGLLFYSSSSHDEATGKDILVAKLIGGDWDKWSAPKKWEQLSTKGSESTLTFISKDEVIWSSSQNSKGFDDLMTFGTSVQLNIPSEFQEFSLSSIPPVKLRDPSPEPLLVTPKVNVETTTPAKSEAITQEKKETTPTKKEKPTPRVKEKPTPRVNEKTTTLFKSEGSLLAKVKTKLRVNEKNASPIKPEASPKVKKKTAAKIATPTLPVESSKSAANFSEVVSEPVKLSDAEATVTWLVMDEKLKIEIPYTIQWMKANIPSYLPNESKISALEKEGITKVKIFSKGYFPVLLPMEELISKGRTLVLMTKAENGNSIILKDIQFKVGTAELEGEKTFQSLMEMADFLNEQPNLIIRINGHTDNVGDPTLNKELSLQRAISVRNYLIANGVNFEKLRISGWGGSKPISSNTTEFGRSKNRRVEFTIEN